MNHSILQNCLHIPTSNVQLNTLFGILGALPKMISIRDSAWRSKDRHEEFLRVLRHVYDIHDGEYGIGKNRFNTIVFELEEVDMTANPEATQKQVTELSEQFAQLIGGPFSVQPEFMDYTNGGTFYICVAISSAADYPGFVPGTSHQELSLRLLQQLTEETKNIISDLSNFEEDAEVMTTLFVHKSIFEQYVVMAMHELYYTNEYHVPASGRFNVKMVLTKPNPFVNGRSVEHIMVTFTHDHD